MLAQADIPDETFAQGILGPGCGIEPTGKTVYAPFDGTVEQVASTLHAVGLTSEDGIEILIHVGMDTVEMQGKGFKALVKVGDKVKAGTPLLKVDLDAIRAAGHPTATAIIVTNGDDMGELKMLAEGRCAGRHPAVQVLIVIVKGVSFHSEAHAFFYSFSCLYFSTFWAKCPSKNWMKGPRAMMITPITMPMMRRAEGACRVLFMTSFSFFLLFFTILLFLC